MDAGFRLARRRKLEEAARLDRAAGTRHRSSNPRIILQRSRESLPRLASAAAIHVSARLKREEFHYRVHGGRRDEEENGMKARVGWSALAGCLLMTFVVTILRPQAQAQEKSSTKEWPVVEPNAL